MEGLRNILFRLGVCFLFINITIAGQYPDLLDATLAELRHGLDSGLFTSVDLTKAYIARIEEVNEQLHAVNEINPDALTIAAEKDAERKKGIAGCGPLHGIPVLIKDNIASADKLNNTAGSYALLGAKVPQDSGVVARLRKSGAILLGKANLSEYANFRSEKGQENGWSAYTGQTVGAYYPGQDPLGSSSGSGVSGSIGLSWACLGTETSGSIISPSSENNLVGIKPTVGLTSRFLVVPISEHQDTVGAMARTVKDAAHLLQAIAGKDKNDNYTSAIPFDTIPNYKAACKKSGLEGKRLGVSRNLIATYGADDYVLAEFNKTLDVLRSAGATIVDDVFLPGIKGLTDFDYSLFVLGADIVTDMPKYFSELKTNPNNIHDLAELQTFVQNCPAEEYPKRDTAIWQMALDLGIDNTAPKFWEVYQKQLELAGPQGLTGALKNHSLDALVAPSQHAAIIAAYIGAPVVTVPLGRMPDDTPVTPTRTGGLNATGPNQPFGIGFTADLFSEETLIEIAYAYEQKTNVRKQVHPMVIPKTQLQDVVGKKA